MTIIIDRTVWVLREDYEALKAENARLAAALDEARAELAADAPSPTVSGPTEESPAPAR